MNNKVKTWLLVGGLVIILLLPIIFEYNAKKRVDILSYNEYTALLDKDAFALVYFGDTDATQYNDVKEGLSLLKQEFDINIVAVNHSKLNVNDKKELNEVVTTSNSPAYVFIKEKRIVHVVEGNITVTKLKVLIDKYYNGVIPPEEVAYKTLVTYDEFIGLAKAKKVAMFVFGRENCPYCNKFKPIYNEVAGEYNIDIYYVNILEIDRYEYDQIMNSGFKIPAECVEDNREVSLNEMNGVPLTIFTKDGKTIGCISGAANKERLLDKLKTVGMIK